MSTIAQRSLRNRLLGKLSPEDFALLSSHATPRNYETNESITEADQSIGTVFFPEEGVVSIVTDNRVHIGLVGREGMTGHSVLLACESSPLKAMCQTRASGTCIPAGHFASALAASQTLNRLALRYVHSFLVQIASCVHANGKFKVEQRLARWLLMCRDRGDGDDLQVTHELIAERLGVRRPGVTVATHVLEGLGYIRARRGWITIRDVAQLREFAGESYGTPEAEYERVMQQYE